MVSHNRALGKRAAVRFAVPPWCEEHPRWQELDQELAEDHLAREVVAAMAHLDLTPLWRSYSASGSPPIRPDLMLRIALIEVRRGRYRPQHWFQDTQENETLKWAGFGICPSRTAWYDFHDRIGPFLEHWNQAIVEATIAAEPTEASQASLDGSTIAANASRHRLLNQACLTKRLEQLHAACAIDEQEKSVVDVPKWMAKTPETRRTQCVRYKQADRRLGELQAVNHRQNPARRRDPAKIVVSTSDPEAALGRDKFHVFRPLYNVQLVCDLNRPLILAYGVFAQPTDAGTLKPMLGKLKSIQGLSLSDLLVDAGYVTASQVALCEHAGVTLYGPWQENDYSKKNSTSKDQQSKQISKDQFTWLQEEQQYVCPQGHRLTWIGQNSRRQADDEVNVVHSYRCSPKHCCQCPLRARCTSNPQRGRTVKRSEHEALVVAHRERMATDDAKELYKKRKQTVELGFADMKEHRATRRFSRRGLTRARSQIGLLVLANNMLAYHRATITEQSLAPGNKKCLATAA